MTWTITPEYKTTITVPDTDANAYLQAVAAADGQGLEPAVAFAVNNFVVGCKADGIWSAIKASCILAGARTLNGALVPLVGTAPTNFNFVSGDYNRETGLVGNGSTKYLNSNRANNADPQNNQHLSVYLSTAGTNAYIGTNNSGGGDTFILVGSASVWPFRSRIASFDEAAKGTRTLVDKTGFIALSRAGSTSFTSRVDSANQTITSTSQTAPSSAIGVFARIGPGTIVDSRTTARIAFYSIGESLNLALLDSRVTTLISAIAAAIP